MEPGSSPSCDSSTACDCEPKTNGGRNHKYKAARPGLFAFVSRQAHDHEKRQTQKCADSKCGSDLSCRSRGGSRL